MCATPVSSTVSLASLRKPDDVCKTPGRLSEQRYGRLSLLWSMSNPRSPRISLRSRNQQGTTSLSRRRDYNRHPMEIEKGYFRSIEPPILLQLSLAVTRRHLPSVVHGKVPRRGSPPKSRERAVSEGNVSAGDTIRRARELIYLVERIEQSAKKDIVSTIRDKPIERRTKNCR